MLGGKCCFPSTLHFRSTRLLLTLLGLAQVRIDVRFNYLEVAISNARRVELMCFVGYAVDETKIPTIIGLLDGISKANNGCLPICLFAMGSLNINFASFRES